MLLIYSSDISARLQYISKTLFGGIVDFSLTANKNEYYSSSASAKINYSTVAIIPEELHIIPHHLLFEKKIRTQEVKCSEYNGRKIFFQNTEGYPFDIFAASFYLLSRYEEYLPHESDVYGRFAHTNALAFREIFLDIPLVNFWMKDLINELQGKSPAFSNYLPGKKESSINFIPTYDIDMAYAFLHKGFLRNAGGLFKDIISGNFKEAGSRVKVLSGRRNDPFDSYEWMDKLHATHQVNPIMFFLLAKESRGYDKNLPPSVPAMRHLIKKLGSKYDPGIHPSWQSGDNPDLVLQEKRKLEEITGKEITKSRQHYIRMQLPGTYRQLIDSGIAEDYSMGYGSINGFRASFAQPFYWYDIEREKETLLNVFPFCFMDANSYYEQKFTVEQTRIELDHYLHTAKQVNGTLITIWHNTFLGTGRRFAGWRELYEEFTDKASA